MFNGDLCGLQGKIVVLIVFLKAELMKLIINSLERDMFFMIKYIYYFIL